MAMNDPNDTPTVRAPRLRILNNGQAIPGALSFEVNSNGWYQADTFSAEFSTSAGGGQFGINWWGAQENEILLDIQASLDAGASWTSLLFGQVDNMSVHVERGICQVQGRDLTARLIDDKTNEPYLNKTSSQIIEILAQKFGLKADVVPTSVLVNRYYDIDHDRISANDFVRTTTSWNLACSLAQHENYDIWVTDTTLHFRPHADQSQDPYVVQWDQANLKSNAIELTLQRSMSFAKDIVVAVRSFHSGQSTSITAYAPSGARQSAIASGKAQEYAYTFPNLTRSEAQDRANRIRADLTAHERLLQFHRPADLKLGARDLIRLEGTNSSWDQMYFCDSVVREMSFDKGFTMTVRAKNHNPQTTVLTT